MGERETRAPSRASLDDLPVLIARLGEDLATLVDSKLGLLKVEIQEDATAYLGGVLSVVAGALVAAIGFTLASVAVALLVAHALASTDLAPAVRYALGFLSVGVVYLGLGVAYARQRLAGNAAP